MTNNNYKGAKRGKGISTHSNYNQVEIPLKLTLKSTTNKIVP